MLVAACGRRAASQFRRVNLGVSRSSSYLSHASTQDAGGIAYSPAVGGVPFVVGRDVVRSPFSARVRESFSG